MISRSAVAAYRKALKARGEEVTVQRETGFAPNVTVVAATVQAVVMKYLPDHNASERTGYSAGDIGSITQGDRMLILMSADLQGLNFPLPVQKNDRIILSSTGEKLNTTDVDMQKRALAGAIELRAGGVD